MSQIAFLDHRRAGVLLHPTSLPGEYGTGDIGAEAYHFIDFMVASGLSVWQMLPLGPTHNDGSPYQCLSVHASNTQLIDLDWLERQGWLKISKIEADRQSTDFREQCLRQAFSGFQKQAQSDWHNRLQQWANEQSYWLDDYALFMAIKQARQDATWNDWPAPLRQREAGALVAARRKYRAQMDFIVFGQFVFHTQWHALREYARARSILLFGDMPFYVAYDSADVWAQREHFLIDRDGHCSQVAGVPPDAFSEQGQRWGNPLYDWSHHQQSGFRWWQQRFASQLEYFDLIRIDHFRGLEACWHIDADEPTAIHGHWVNSPGQELLQSLTDAFGPLPLVAEDLGLITNSVIDLREQFHLPGMKVLQFAFDGDARNLYLPHNHQRNGVVYTGTHDNNTTLGWYRQLDPDSRRFLHHYLGVSESTELDMPWVMNRLALCSVAELAVLPMQDILSLDAHSRMNVPGTTEGNWQWRFEWSQLWPQLAADLRQLSGLYQRLI